MTDTPDLLTLQAEIATLKDRVAKLEIADAANKLGTAMRDDMLSSLLDSLSELTKSVGVLTVREAERSGVPIPDLLTEYGYR
jgi:hypothetical protein